MRADVSDAVVGAQRDELTQPRLIQHALGPHLAEFGKFGSRRALERSALYKRLGEAVRDVTFAIEHGRAAVRPEYPSGARSGLRVVAWNVQRGARLAGVIHVLKTHPELSCADVVMLLESDVGMARSGNRNVAREVADALGYDYVFGNSYLCLTGGNRREAVQTSPNSLALAGNAILSRLPMLRATNFSLAITKDKFETSEKRLGHKKALLVELLVDQQRVGMCAAHLDSAASSTQRAAQLLDAVNMLDACGADCSLIGGDFNTTTYDANHVGALLASLVKKLWRGGFPHAIFHYLHPELLYERPVFEVLRRAGYDFETHNEVGVGTLRYTVGEAASEGRVQDFLPEPFVQLLRRKLKPYGGAVALRLDWFAGRGSYATRSGTVHRPQFSGMGVSDHDPIWVDVELPKRKAD